MNPLSVEFDVDSLPGPARRGSVRYADPVAWLFRDVLERGLGEAVMDRSAVGVIAVTEHATAGTLQAVAQESADGRVSPLHFVAASPGTVIGLACTQLGINGPSLLLTMPPREGLPTARTLASLWLTDRQPSVRAVAVVSHEVTPVESHRLTFELICSNRTGECSPE